MTDDILDDLFHAVSFTAFIELARQQKGWPDPEAVRQRACQLYEAALADKDANRPPPPAPPQSP